MKMKVVVSSLLMSSVFLMISCWTTGKGPTSFNFRARNVLKTSFLNSVSLTYLSPFLGTITAPRKTKAYGIVAEPIVKKKNDPKAGETDLGIKYIDLRVGVGPYPYEGDLVAINYIGFKIDGTEFDSQYAKKNLAFKFGSKQIIPGIEDVLATMRPGGQRSCIIPPKFAYGEKGVCFEDGCIVEPNEDLKFVISLRTVGVGYN